MKNEKNNVKNESISYSIGLDIGTNSVGWSVVNNNYQLLKKGNKNLWGVRLFDPAETAAVRRGDRSIRRRYNKRRERIRLLREIIGDIVLEKDPAFFIRMNDASFLDESDKLLVLGNSFKGNYNLFSDKDFTDENFYKAFPTIYHLREHLCKSDKMEDPRLIYLALHHIVKYRGNFLYENQNFSSGNGDVEESLTLVLNKIIEMNEMNLVVNADQVNEILSVLKKQIARKQKSGECAQIISSPSEYKQIVKNISDAICGNSFSVTKLFIKEEIKHDDKEMKLKFADDKYEENISEYESELGDYIEIISDLQKIYSWMELQNILGSETNENVTLSTAMVNRYDKHKDDLRLLKKIIKEFDKTLYFEVFLSTENKIHNYANYINHPAKTPRDLFYGYLKKILSNIDNEDANYCLNEIERENFLLRQNDRNNGAIPYQLNLDDMKQILEKQSKYYPVLKENMDKIISILTFRIPYYYGPLDGNEKFGWLVKREGKENERILPWNHSDVVDVEETASKFIEKLTNYCTYLPNETVMPKYSLTCKKYEVLAELNKIRINGHLIKDTDIKNQIIEDLFMKRKKVTDAHLKEWLKKSGFYMNCDEFDIIGYQKEDMFASSLDSWIDFQKIVGEITEDNYLEIEDIIKDLTVYNDPYIIKRRIKNAHKDLNEKQIKKILNLKYQGWSRLSSKLINGLYADNEFGSSATILDVMEHSSKTLMEIISDPSLGYKQIIDEENKLEIEGSIQYEDVASLAGSPAIKKGIWQSLLVVDEIVHYMKHNPTNIYIEFAREEGKKQRTQSQVKKLLNIYKDLDLQTKHDHEVYAELKEEDSTKKIDTDRLYLYYTQMGKCMYSDKELDIDQLEKYHIDHIVPQSLIKDDSLDNKVLVISKENERKLDDDVIPEIIRNRMEAKWKYLYDHKLISNRKYFALIRTEINDSMKEKFINRQLVETRQITKNVANILTNYYPETKVKTIRANLITDFRNKYKIPKNRNVNDFHHAHDAYIATLIGQFVNYRFPKLEDKYEFSKYLKFSKDSKKSQQKDGFILNSMNQLYCDIDTGEIIWDPSMIDEIQKCFYYHDYYVSRKLEVNDSSLFKVTIHSNDNNSEKGKTEASIPVNLKRSDVHKYGGYSSIQYNMYAIEGFDKKGKLVRKVTNFPVMFKHNEIAEKIRYIEEQEQLIDVMILKEIMKNQLIEINGGLYQMSSAEELVNARQLHLQRKDYNLVSEINKALSKDNYKDFRHEDMNKMYITLIEKMIKFYPKYLGIAKMLSDSNDLFISLEIKDKCKIINEIINVLSAGKQNGNFKNTKLTSTNKSVGRLSHQKVYLDDTKFYNQSITGIYTKKYKL